MFYYMYAILYCLFIIIINFMLVTIYNLTYNHSALFHYSMDARNNPLVEKHIIRGVQWKYRISQNNYDRYFPAKESHVWFLGDHPADPNQCAGEMSSSWKNGSHSNDSFMKIHSADSWWVRRLEWTTEAVRKNRFTEMSPASRHFCLHFPETALYCLFKMITIIKKRVNISTNTVKITFSTN